MTWCNKHVDFYYLFNKVSVHFYLSYFHALYLVSTLDCIFYIVRDLGALGVAQKMQVTSSLQIGDLFTAFLGLVLLFFLFSRHGFFTLCETSDQKDADHLPFSLSLFLFFFIKGLMKNLNVQSCQHCCEAQKKGRVSKEKGLKKLDKDKRKFLWVEEAP